MNLFRTRATTPTARCGNCARFDAAPRALEQAFPGMASMGSGFSSVRGDDGLCSHHGRYLTESSSCSSFQPRTSA